MMRIILSVLLILLTAGGVFAQDPQFSQYYQSPLYLNPGFTGITPQQRAVFNNRIQWPNLPQAYTTFAASYDIWVDELRSGFGIIAMTDKMGSAGWRTTTAGLNYSYKVRLNEKLVFSPGLYFGYGINGLDRSKLRLGDGLEYNGISLDPELQKLGNQQYFDIGSGFFNIQSHVMVRCCLQSYEYTESFRFKRSEQACHENNHSRRSPYSLV